MIGVATNFGPNVLVLHNVLQPALFVVEFVSIAENVATLWSLKLLQKNDWRAPENRRPQFDRTDRRPFLETRKGRQHGDIHDYYPLLPERSRDIAAGAVFHIRADISGL
jgi:hypothetical protein